LRVLVVENDRELAEAVATGLRRAQIAGIGNAQHKECNEEAPPRRRLRFVTGRYRRVHPSMLCAGLDQLRASRLPMAESASD